MAHTKEGMDVSKSVLLAIIAVLILILLFTFVPGLRALFNMDKENEGSSAPVNVRVNGETVRTSGSSGTTRNGSSQGTDRDDAVNVNVDETDDGTVINIQVPEDVDVNAEGTPAASVGPLPNL